MSPLEDGGLRIASLEAKKDSIFVIEVSLPLTSNL
jgi:hypothetical protein